MRPVICEIRLLTVALIASVAFFFFSCGKEEVEPECTPRTTFVYFPWSTNLTGYFYENIAGLEDAIEAEGLGGGKVIVFLSTNASDAQMFEIVCKNGTCCRSVLKEYKNPRFTTEAGLTEILNDMKRFAPAASYSMIIGSHGMGWLPVTAQKSRRTQDFRYYWDYEGMPLTRFFGGLSPECQTDISTLANSMAHCNLFMEYILFDDCYMSSLEVAYELRHVTSHIIASPTEIMAIGMPYRKMGKYLLAKNPDYSAICETFYNFYSTYQYPFGTLAVTDCRELDGLAALMKHINGRYALGDMPEGKIQRMDGYNPVIFYDYGDYVKALCGRDNGQFQVFAGLLDKAVPYKTHTGSFYSASCGVVPIRSYSGITTSEPSHNIKARNHNQTLWYRDTH